MDEADAQGEIGLFVRADAVLLAEAGDFYDGGCHCDL